MHESIPDGEDQLRAGVGWLAQTAAACSQSGIAVRQLDRYACPLQEQACATGCCEPVVGCKPLPVMEDRPAQQFESGAGYRDPDVEYTGAFG